MRHQEHNPGCHGNNLSARPFAPLSGCQLSASPRIPGWHPPQATAQTSLEAQMKDTERILGQFQEPRGGFPSTHLKGRAEKEPRRKKRAKQGLSGLFLREPPHTPRPSGLSLANFRHMHCLSWKRQHLSCYLEEYCKYHMTCRWSRCKSSS